MKKLFITLLALLFAVTVIAQEVIQVDVTKLTQRQLQVYQELKQQAENPGMSLDSLTPEKVDKYAQMGKGIGIAINEGLGAVTKNVEQFSQTSAGKWLMVLITWKVMGEDAISLTRSCIQWVIGGGLLLAGIPFFMWIIRRNCVLPPVASVEKIGFWTRKVTYHSGGPVHDDELYIYGLFFGLFLAVVAAITFIH